MFAETTKVVFTHCSFLLAHVERVLGHVDLRKGTAITVILQCTWYPSLPVSIGRGLLTYHGLDQLWINGGCIPLCMVTVCVCTCTVHVHGHAWYTGTWGILGGGVTVRCYNTGSIHCTGSEAYTQIMIITITQPLFGSSRRYLTSEVCHSQCCSRPPVRPGLGPAGSAWAATYTAKRQINDACREHLAGLTSWGTFWWRKTTTSRLMS